MFAKLLAATDFGQWSSFVTPAFFDVVPPLPLWRIVKELAQNSRDREGYARVVGERRALLARSPLRLALEAPGVAVAPETAVAAGSRPGLGPAQARATCVVELYFHQLLHGEVCLLDLRAEAFSPGLPSSWRPAAWFVRWDARFLVALRQLYTGFYDDDAAGFRAGLAALNLSSAEGVFRQHFGDGQRAVRFQVREFIATFHQVFSRCRDARVQLHSDFLPLGLYLATLYDHLEQLGAAVDVHAAFRTAATLSSEPAPSTRRAGPVARGERQ